MSTGSLLTSTGTKTLFVFVASSTGFCLTKFNSRKLYAYQAFKSETCEVYVAKESSFTSNPKSVMSSAKLRRQVTAVCKFMWFVHMENNVGERTHVVGCKLKTECYSGRPV